MITIETTHIIHLPISRKDAGFPDPDQGDRGNAFLLDARDTRKPEYLAAYWAAGFVTEGVRISACDEEVYALLEQMELPWCPWPDEGFTLAVMEHCRVGVLADWVVVQRLMRVEQSDARESVEEGSHDAQ